MLAAAAALSAAWPAPQAGAQTGVHQRYGETRAYFRDWLAACRPGGYCSVLGYNGAGPNAAGVDANYILRVAQPEAGGRYEVIFTGVQAYASDESAIDVFVDGRPVQSFEPTGDESWFRPPQVANEHQIPTSPSQFVIVPAMKAGRSMTVVFQDTEGRNRQVAFSLMGLSAALRWIEQVRMQ